MDRIHVNELHVFTCELLILISSGQQKETRIFKTPPLTCFRLYRLCPRTTWFSLLVRKNSSDMSKNIATWILKFNTVQNRCTAIKESQKECSFAVKLCQKLARADSVGNQFWSFDLWSQRHQSLLLKCNTFAPGFKISMKALWDD